jgi:general secretion pathway protein G
MTSRHRFILIFCWTATLLVTPQVSLASRSLGMRAATDIATISTVLEMYKMDTGDYPTQSQGLAALSTKPEGVDSSLWYGPYLEKGAPKDPWGNDYVYVIPGKHSREGFDVYSLGRDGESTTGGNDPDDINNWDPESGYSYYGLDDPLWRVANRLSLFILGLFVALAFAVHFVRSKRARRKEST